MEPVIFIGFLRKPSLVDALVGLELPLHHVLLGATPPFLLVLDNRLAVLQIFENNTPERG